MEIKDIDITQYYCGPLDKAEVLMELYNNYARGNRRSLTIEQARYLIEINTPWQKDCFGRDVESTDVLVENINGMDVSYHFFDNRINLTCVGIPKESIESVVKLLEEKKRQKCSGYEVAFKITQSEYGSR